MNPEIWGAVATIAVSIVAGYWAIGKLVVAQFDKRLDERFHAQDEARKEGKRQWDERFQKIEARGDRFERDLTQLMRDLPSSYVRREDAIRENTTLNAKLDALNARMEHLITNTKGIMK